MKNHRHGYGERAAATLVEKMLSAVLYCHHNGVVHRCGPHQGPFCKRLTPLPEHHRTPCTRTPCALCDCSDIKLDNFIYEHEAEDAELKLIDFGFAAEVCAAHLREGTHLREGGERFQFQGYKQHLSP